ncbi:zinc-ribbon domain-containing protein [Acetobacterium tundrae]|uniref:Zinc-ribbon domain-containing protein n=1 Tax=Acetobacterium tundrae TaxID=132932 RepID=A0ABR6WLC3_9FIRM|nr:zinc ribbon domain-containing protein [Acetobacterium tundrae]MBC3797310.1 hypothetical protein [Acetobacterium tundrae]
MNCKKCGAPITADTEFCRQCGTATREDAAPPLGGTNSLVGWSTHWQDPEIMAAVKKKNATAVGFAWALALVFPIGFLIAGLLIKTMPLAGGLIIGIVLGIVMLGINMFYIKTRKNQIWEGVITEKYELNKHADDDSDDDDDIEYVLVVQKTNGQKHKMIYNNRREMYDYFEIGDRIRYHSGLSTYEKYDKSRDHIIYCNVCSAENLISNDRCDCCNSPLFK